MQTCIPKCMHVRTHAHTHNTHMHTHSDGQTHTHMHAHSNMHTYVPDTYVHTSEHMHTHTQTHTHKHTHYCINHFNSKNMRSILVTKSTNANYQNTNGSPTKRWHILAGSYRKMKHLGIKNWGTNKLAWILKNTRSILLTKSADANYQNTNGSPTKRWHILAGSYQKMKHLGSIEPKY